MSPYGVQPHQKFYHKSMAEYTISQSVQNTPQSNKYLRTTYQNNSHTASYQQQANHIDTPSQHLHNLVQYKAGAMIARRITKSGCLPAHWTIHILPSKRKIKTDDYHQISSQSVKCHKFNQRLHINTSLAHLFYSRGRYVIFGMIAGQIFL